MVIKRFIVTSSVVAALLAAGTAQSHPRLISSTPRANSSVAATNRVALTFSEKLLAPMSGGDIIMTTRPGTRQAPVKVAGFKPSIGGNGKTLELIGARTLTKGSYQVRWHAVAADTHRVAGVLPFQVR